MMRRLMLGFPVLNGQFPVRSGVACMMTCLISGMDMVGSRMKFFTVRFRFSCGSTGDDKQASTGPKSGGA